MNETRPIEVDDAIVLLLGAPSPNPSLEGRVAGITRLEKLVFLLERESPISESLTESADFTSHNFGPFSAEVYRAVDLLAGAGLVEDSARLTDTTEDAWEEEHLIGRDNADPYATRDFALTDRGRRYYDALISELPDGTEAALRDFKDQFGVLPLRQLVRYVYSRYPDFTDKSIIRDEILGH